eukprot:CAMPEP_0113714766 /NCGR_PEP_ID=MMETSP0038_2-20120614/32824_1 /TAXON_ID=2898 /ORGANISM="Cryptomonas paramecium" /LENGTH=283 /DNA_ID=CAMNT_0000641829 /DNA_START=125 /DNA_END=972 /DNA_ORIENTATION=- /assembly_acc=CAM_ASM_000170
MATAAVVSVSQNTTRSSHESDERHNKFDHLIYEKQQLEALLTTKFPDRESIIFDKNLELLMLNGVWRRRRVMYTKEVLVFTKCGVGDESVVFDAVPFFEIESCTPINVTESTSTEASSDHPDSKSLLKRRACDYLPPDRILDASTVEAMVNAIEIKTIFDGYNSGRVYYIQAECGEDCRKMAEEITEHSRRCVQRFEMRSPWNAFRDRVKAIYDSNQVQGLVGCLIIANFVCNIVESQLTGRLTDEHGNPTDSANTLEALDKAFTGVFAFELLVNMVSNLWSR